MPRYGFITTDGGWMHFDGDKAEVWPKDAAPGQDVMCYTEDWRLILCRGGLNATTSDDGVQRFEMREIDAMRWFLDRGMELPRQLDAYLLDFDSALWLRKQGAGVMMWPPPEFPHVDDDEIPWGGFSLSMPDRGRDGGQESEGSPITDPAVETLYYLPDDDTWIHYYPWRRGPKSALGPPRNRYTDPESASKWLLDRGYELPPGLLRSSEPGGQQEEPDTNHQQDGASRSLGKPHMRIMDALGNGPLKGAALHERLGGNVRQLKRYLADLRLTGQVAHQMGLGYYRTDTPPPSGSISPP